MTNTLGPLCVIIYYPIGAGGKFIATSLGLSRYFAPPNSRDADLDFTQTTFDSNYYQTKLKHALDTVPPVVNAQKWQQYEIWSWLHARDRMQLSDNLQKIVNANKYVWVEANDAAQVSAVVNHVPGIKHIIKLTNYTNWLKTASFKNKDLANDIDNRIAYWKYIDQQELKSFNFPHMLVDIDSNMFDRDAMGKQIKSLYEYIDRKSVV